LASAGNGAIVGRRGAYLLRNGSNDYVPAFPENAATRCDLANALLSVAAINIKKSGGKSNSSWEDLEQ
jgi:hypothetical protein